jgi:hypothetical protein
MDGVKAPRPFEGNEQSDLCDLLKSTLHLHNVSCPFQAEADAEDVLNYIFDMVTDGENVGHVINEVRDLGFDEICSQESLEKIRECLAEFLVKMEGKNGWKDKFAIMKSTGSGGGGDSTQQNNTAVPPPPKSAPAQFSVCSASPMQPEASRQRMSSEDIKERDSSYAEEIKSRERNRHTTVSSVGAQAPGRKMTYAEEIQAREREKGEEVLKNSASMQAQMQSRSGQVSASRVESNGSGDSGSKGRRKMTYAEEIQAREKERGEEVIKNCAKTQAKMPGRAGQVGSSTTVESQGRGYSGTCRRLSYAEEIQAREKERGEEVIKNCAKTQAKMPGRAGQVGSSMTVESQGRGYSGTCRRLSYAEEIQARERERGEEIIKNSARAQAYKTRDYGCSYSEEDSQDNGSGSPDHMNGDLSEGSSFDANTKREMDEIRRQELMAVMKDRSLGKDEKAQKMKEIRDKYETLM